MNGEKSYLVPIDLPYVYGSICGNGIFCYGGYYEGVMLYKGQLMLPIIGGTIFYRRHPVTNEQLKQQPSNATAYVDFKDWRTKWGAKLPEGRHLHCIVKYNESTAFVFGGSSWKVKLKS